MIYLDHHAGAPTVPEALRAMDEARAAAFANPSSTHGAGRLARRWLDLAREQVANALGAAPAEVVFTAGGTEAVNLGVLGMGFGGPGPLHRVVTTAVEHPAVRGAVARLGARGVAVTVLDVSGGRPPAVDEVLRHAAPGVLFALQWVNHETGTVLPVEAWVPPLRERGAHVVVDACQAVGKVPVDVRALGAHAMALGASKVGGGAGAGALWVDRSVQLEPLLGGGGQERGRRPGTPDVVALAGFGAAMATLHGRLAAQAGLGVRRDRLEAGAVALGAIVNGVGSTRVAGCTNVSFRGRRAEVLVAALDLEGICVSAGPACSSGLAEPSPTVKAMFPSEPWRAESAVRFSLGPETPDEHVDQALSALARVLGRASAS